MMSSFKRSEQQAPIRVLSNKQIVSTRKIQALQLCDSNSNSPKFPCGRQNCLEIPRRGFFSQAKDFEEYEQKRETLYIETIYHKDRTEKAINDPTGVMYDRRNTQEGIEMLKADQVEFIDCEYCKNLKQNSDKQLVLKGNGLKTFLRISDLPSHFTPQDIRELFAKPKKIQAVKCFENSAIVELRSHPDAQKSFEHFISSEMLRIDWVSVTDDVSGQAQITKDASNANDEALFLYKVFLKENHERAMLIDASEAEDTPEIYEWTHLDEILYLGMDLSLIINN